MTHGYTEAEKECMANLASAWNSFVGLRDGHPDDANEFRKAIHDAQHIIMARLAARVDPETHPNHHVISGWQSGVL